MVTVQVNHHEIVCTVQWSVRLTHIWAVYGVLPAHFERAGVQPSYQRVGFKLFLELAVRL